MCNVVIPNILVFSPLFCLMFFNWRYQTYSRKEIHNLFYFFTGLFRRCKLILNSVQNKTIFFYSVGLLAATKALQKRKKTFFYTYVF